MSGWRPPADVWRTARSLFFAAVSSGSGVLLLALLVVAGRWLGDRDYGRFTFALALGTIVEMLVDFGLKDYAAREIARDSGRAAPFIAHIFGLKLASGLLCLGLLTAVVWILRPEPEVRLACILVGASSIARSFWMTLRQALNGLQRFDLESLVALADRTMLLVFGVAAIGAGTGLTGLCLAFVIARLGALAIAWRLTNGLVGPLGVAWAPGRWPALLRDSFAFGLYSTLLNLYSYIDIVLLGVLRTDVEVGYYGAAYRLYEGFTNGAVIISTVALPKLSRVHVADSARHARLARLATTGSIAVAVPFVLLGVLFGRPLLETLFGASFTPGTPALGVLSLGLLVVFPLQIAHSIAISTNNEGGLVRAAVVGIVCNVVLNLIAIPRYGITGSAWATLVSEAISLAFLHARVLRRRPAGSLPGAPASPVP
ncbi:MAG: flippase [Vicinamibacterales bacterium]